MLHTEALQKEFDLSFDDAERLKKGVALESVTPEKAEAALRSASEEIAGEVLRSIDYFRSTAYHEDINEVVVSGGGALVSGFPNILADTAGLEVKIAEPFKNIGIPSKYVGLVEDVQCVAAVAVGLALRRPGDR
jgi:type IV pilus assembly protein PilM